jgi:hypothetical protein
MPSYTFHLINPFFLDGIVHQEILANRILDDILEKLNPSFPGVKKFKELTPGYYGIALSGHHMKLLTFKTLVNRPDIQKYFMDIKNWWKRKFLIQEKQQQRLRRQQAAAAAVAASPSSYLLQSWKRLPQQGKSVKEKSIW